MPNIEIKARCQDPARAREIASRIQTEHLGMLHQVDSYFHTAQGRLKLREIDGPKGPSEKSAYLVPYLKTYEDRPARSDYQLLPVADPQATLDLFSRLLGLWFVVDKRREVFLIHNVRIHLDEVKGLGNFIEFEAVFDQDTPEVRARETRKVRELMETFGLSGSDLVTHGYVDLLSRAAEGSAPRPPAV